METPMMANNGAPKNKGSLIGLIFHEISHSYFPFYMGTNERKYGWMDEGCATFFPGVVVDSLVPGYDYYRDLIRGYEYFAGTELELPMMIPTFGLPSQSSGTASYSRPGTAYMELQKLLGNDLFKKVLEMGHRHKEYNNSLSMMKEILENYLSQVPVSHRERVRYLLRELEAIPEVRQP